MDSAYSTYTPPPVVDKFHQTLQDQADFFSTYASSLQGEERVHYDERLKTSIAVSENYGIPLSDMMSRYDDIASELFPELAVKENLGQYAITSAKIGNLNREVGMIGLELMNAGLSDSEALQNKLKEIENLSRSIPDSWFTKGAGSAIQSLSLMGPSMLASAVAGGAASAMATPAVGAAVATGVSAALNSPVYVGLSYVDMVKAGIDPRIAKPYSVGSGAIQGAVEAALSALPFEGFVTKLLADKVAKKLFKSGAVTTAVKTYLGRAAINGVRNIANAPMEGVEEVAQALAGNVAMELAASESDKQYGFVDWNEVNARKEDILESFMGGISLSLYMGIPLGAVKGIKTIAEAKNIASAAKEAVKNAVDTESALERLNETVVGDTKLGDIIDRESALRFVEADRAREEAEAASLVEGEWDKPIVEFPLNSIEGAAIVKDENFGTYREAVIGIQDEYTPQDAAIVRYNTKDNRTVIEKIRVAQGVTKEQAAAVFANEKGEALYNGTLYTPLETAQETAGEPVVSTEGEAVEVETAEETEDTADANAESETETLPKDRALPENFLKKIQNLKGKEQVIRIVKDIDALFPAFQNTIQDMVSLEGILQDTKGRLINGVFDVSGDTIKIRLSSSADVQTYLHEVGHAFQAMLTEEEKAAWNETNPKNPIETTEGKEEFVDALLQYLREGYAPKGLQGVVARLKDFITRLAQNLTALKPKVVRFFNETLPVKERRWNEKTIEEIRDKRVKAAPNLGSIAKIAAEEVGQDIPADLYEYADRKHAQARRQHDEVRETYTDAQLRTAPNGKPITHLNDDQLVLIRTPFFKRLFGDWETLEQQKVLRKLIDKSLTEKTWQTRTKIAEGVNADPSGKLSQAFGFTVEKQYITPDDIRKIIKRHGAGNESRAGQLEITQEDFLKAFEVLKNPETYRNTKSNNGKPSVEFGKTFTDGTIIVAEVETAEKGSVSLKALWKKSDGGIHAGANSYPNRTSKNTAEPAISIHSDSLIVNPSDVSKVRDENGVPLVVYHYGTFKKTDIPKGGMHFGTEKAAADRAKQRRTKKETERNAVFLNIRNPITVPDNYSKDWSKTIEWAKAKGHDGIEYVNRVEDKGSTSYIAFFPNQIKSATDNAGTFDPGEDSILLEIAGETGAAALDAAADRARLRELEVIVDWLFTSPPVSSLSGTEFAKSDVDLVTQVDTYFKSIGGKVEREGLGTVILDRDGVQSSIGHKLGRNKAVSFTAVPEIIKHGKIVDYQNNWKGRGYDTYVIDAPISIGGKPFIGEVVLTKKKGDAKFYLHEVETQEKLPGASIQAGTKSGTPVGASRLIIAQLLSDVKGNVEKSEKKAATPPGESFDVVEEGLFEYAFDDHSLEEFIRDNPEELSALSAWNTERIKNYLLEFLKDPFEGEELMMRDGMTQEQREKLGYFALRYRAEIETKMTETGMVGDDVSFTDDDFDAIIDAGDFIQDLVKQRKNIAEAEFLGIGSSQEEDEYDDIIRRATKNPLYEMYMKSDNPETLEKIKAMMKNHRRGYRNIYAELTGDPRWKTGEADEVETAANPEAMESLIQKLNSDKAKKAITQKLLPTPKEISDLIKELNDETRDARKRLGDHGNRLEAALGEIAEAQERVDILSKTARQSSEAAKALQDAMKAHRDTLKKYDEIVGSITKQPVQSRKDIIQAVKDIEYYQRDIETLEAIEKTAAKAFRVLYRKPPNDIARSHAKTLRNIRVVSAEDWLPKYIRGMDEQGLGAMELVWNEYRRDSGAFKKNLKQADIEWLKTHLLEDDGGGVWKPWGNLDKRERQRLGKIFSFYPKLEAGRKALFRQAAQSPKFLESVMVTLSAKDAKRLQRMVDTYNKARLKNRKEKLPPGNALIFAVRRLTGKPEWAENLELQAFDQHEREKAAAELQADDKLSAEAKDLLRFEDGKLVYSAAAMTVDQMATLVNEVSRIKREGREIERVKMEAREAYKERIAKSLAEYVSPYYEGMPVEKHPKYKGEYNPDKKYAKGDLVDIGNKHILYIAPGDDTPVGNWERAVVSQSNEKPTRYQKNNAARESMLDFTRVGLYQFNQAGEKIGESYFEREVVTKQHRAMSQYLGNVADRKHRLYEALEKAEVKFSDISAINFTIDDAARKVNLLDLMYLWSTKFSIEGRDAAVAGYFATAQEQHDWTTGDLSERRNIEDKAEARYLAAIKQYDEFIAKPEHQKYHTIYQTIREDLAEEYTRLQPFMAENYNLDLGHVEDYMPISRRITGAADPSAAELADTIANGKIKSPALEKGFTKTRNQFTFGNQYRIHTNILSIWDNHVKDAEKLMAYSDFTRLVEGLFVRPRGAEAKLLQSRIENVFGKEGVNWWKRAIQTIYRDDDSDAKTLLDNAIVFARGKYNSAILVGRVASFVTQVLTSPMQSSMEVSANEWISSFDINFKPELLQEMYKASPYMQERSMDAVIQDAQDMMNIQTDYKDGKLTGLALQKRIIGVLSKNLSMADSLSVNPIWYAKYKERIQQLARENNLQFGKNFFDIDDAAKQQAAEYADLVMRRTQPSQFKIDQSEWIQRKNNVQSLFTAFQNPIALLLNEATFDLPGKLKGKYEQARAQALNFIVTAIAISVIRGFMHDKDKEDILDRPVRHVIKWLLGTEGLAGMVPVFGHTLGTFVEAMIMAEKVPLDFQNNNFPVVTSFLKVYNRVMSEDLPGLLLEGVKIASLFFGAFYGMINDWEAFFKKVENEGLPAGFLKMLGVD